jgi:hypothetical protein
VLLKLSLFLASSVPNISLIGWQKKPPKEIGDRKFALEGLRITVDKSA